MALHFLNDVANDTKSTYVIVETMGKLINRIPGSRLLMSSLHGSASRTYVESLDKPRSTSVLEAVPGILDIKKTLT